LERRGRINAHGCRRRKLNHLIGGGGDGILLRKRGKLLIVQEGRETRGEYFEISVKAGQGTEGNLFLKNGKKEA